MKALATREQRAALSFADGVVHVAEGNDFLCGTVAGVPAPQRTKVAATDAKRRGQKGRRATR